MYAYEEFLEKYNVPRKGLPEAVSEAEEYRAKMRAHRGNKSVASPVQTGVSPGSNTVSHDLVGKGCAVYFILACICISLTSASVLQPHRNGAVLRR